ncbi:molybdopterin-dependent oxidoreductase [Mesorhizobium koreense]|uniref:molybdopterin-dependent oxidoreductase n=1 Tax=Mesorhizobium koreense TaxID=3074855 RepID=UPI00287B8238|nr:molybdopterin-dependent oxidoreductase [Mesorhizobium sp. WR6]
MDDLKGGECAASISDLPLTSAHWGTYRVHASGGVPIRLSGFERDPDPSPIGDSMIDTLKGPCRIGKPMVRHGFLNRSTSDTRDMRGRDGFVEMDWDEALDLAAAELSRVRDLYGNTAIYGGSYGWASAGRFHHAQSQLRRFMNLFGGCTVSRDSYSSAAAEVILPHVVGQLSSLFVEHTSWKSIAEGAGLVVAFGGMSIRNSQVNSGTTGSHEQRGDMLAARRNGVRFVNVSPARSDVLDELDAEWLSIRPNTDLALMLGIAGWLLTEERHDQAFLDRYCTGFDRFRDYLTGKTDGIRKTPRWAAGITGISEEEIVRLARLMADTPTMVSASWSLTRQQNGEHNYWMLVVLAAMLGGIGRPGTGFSLGLGAVTSVGKHRGYLPWAALPTGKNPVESFIPVARIADMLLNPGAPFEYDGQHLNYPDIRLVYWAGGNPFHHHQDLNRFRQAWRKVETVIVHEPFWTPLARFADIVFPATVGLERNDLAASPRDGYMFASSKVSEPYGETRNDHEIFAGLAARLTPGQGINSDFEQAFRGGHSESEWLGELYEESRRRGREVGHDLPDYETFLRTGIFKLEPPARPMVMLEDFRRDPGKYPLSTPSGRIEIFSATIAGFGLADNPGHPVWHSPDEWLGSSLARRFPLHLISHQPSRRLHSQLDHGAHSRAGKIKGHEVCRMNGTEAAKRSIASGDLVRIFNDRGACIAAAEIDDRIRDGVAMIATGAWYDPDWDADPACCKHGNANTLTADRPTSPIAQGPSAQTCLVEVTSFDGDAPEVTAFVPPRIGPAPSS